MTTRQSLADYEAVCASGNTKPLTRVERAAQADERAEARIAAEERLCGQKPMKVWGKF